MSDPAVVAAQRAMKAVHDYPEPNYDLIVAAREALKSIRDRHKPARFIVCDTGPFCPICDVDWPCADARDSYSTKEIEVLLAEWPSL